MYAADTVAWTFDFILKGTIMKFFTPEWQNDLVVSELCFQIRKTQKAAIFSDKFFEKLYSVEKKAYLRHCKRAAKFEGRKYAEAEASAQFQATYKENLEYAEDNIPEEILSQVADIRVFALGSVTYDIANQLTRYCGKLNRKCKKVEDDYDAELEKVAEITGWYTVNFLNYLIGAPIALVCEDNGDVVITTSHEYTGTAVKIVLHNARITQKDAEVVGSAVLKHELTRSQSEDGQFDFSILCSSPSASLCTLSASGSSIEVFEI